MQYMLFFRCFLSSGYVHVLKKLGYLLSVFLMKNPEDWNREVGKHFCVNVRCGS